MFQKKNMKKGLKLHLNMYNGTNYIFIHNSTKVEEHRRLHKG